MGVSMATERPILDALKQAFAAMIPVLLAWLMKMMVPATPALKVAQQTETSPGTNGDSPVGPSVDV